VQTRVEAGQGGFDEVVLVSDHGTARVSTLGATVLSWVPRGGDEVLWRSPLSPYEVGRGIRGGIPVCWPWFGDRAPDGVSGSHGLVRGQRWTVEALSEEDSGAHVRLGVAHAGQMGVPAFRLTLSVRLTRELTLKLTHENAGTETAVCAGALHTYLRADARVAYVDGLQGCSAFDKLTAQTVVVGARQGFAEPVDRVVACGQTVRLVDGARVVEVGGRHHSDVIVWNPGVESPTDVPVGGHEGFVCVETGVVSEPWRIGPGEHRMLGLRLRV
jgi:glucose-6-phosphate 1-epimerase